MFTAPQILSCGRRRSFALLCTLTNKQIRRDIKMFPAPAGKPFPAKGGEFFDHSFSHRQRKNGPPEVCCLRRSICVLRRIALVNLPVPFVFSVLSRRRSPPSSPGSVRPASPRTWLLFSCRRSGPCASR